MENKSIIIIGAGIAGLSAGCYAQMNGYNSSIYEMHSIPGGLCTSWKRKGYTFDGCIDWLTGSAPDGMFFPIWQELGVIDNNSFLYTTEFCHYVSKDNKEIIIYTDIDRLRAELLLYSPEDSEPIEELFSLILRFKDFRPDVKTAIEIMGLAGSMKMLAGLLKNVKAYKDFFKYGKTSLSEFAERFKSLFLRDMLTSIWGGDIPLSLFAATMAWYSNNTAGFPEGGSIKIAEDIEKKYMELKGRTYYGHKVEKIIVDNNKAVGIKLADGTEKYSDIVLSASDGHSTIFNMLDGRYISDIAKKWYLNASTFPPYVQISLGIARDLSDKARTYFFKTDKPLTAGNQKISGLIVHNYSFDKTLAPEEKTSLCVRFFTDYDYWLDLYKDKTKYKEVKENLANSIIKELDNHFAGISSLVEVIDVATPATYMRYTGNWRGATMSWLPTSENFGKNIKKTLPGLDNFYMAGHWLVPGGGLPNAVKTARDVIQIICRKDRKRFKTSS